MDDFIGKGATSSQAMFQLETGTNVLEEWSETARQSERDKVYSALFAVLDGSLFRDYRIVDDFQHPSELFVLVTDEIVLKIRINCFDSFSIVRIGSRKEMSRTRGFA